MFKSLKKNEVKNIFRNVIASDNVIDLEISGVMKNCSKNPNNVVEKVTKN